LAEFKLNNEDQSFHLLELVEEFADSYLIDDRDWIESAKNYAAKNEIDEDILIFLLQRLLWFQIRDQRRYYWIGKRIFDICLSTLLMFFLSPVIFVIGCIVKLSSSGPIFYKQIRIGKNGTPFWIYKFRSMYAGSKKKFEFLNTNPIKETHDSRVTKVGIFFCDVPV
jgi:lipopolysaccharide/colanic/teichoic acid biosynthesis glycosyltransferase